MQQIGLMRKAALGAVFAISVFSAGSDAARAEAMGDMRESLNFKVLRDGAPIGHHSIAFNQVGDELHVDVAIDLEVNFAFITLFRYEHRAKEVWRDGRLVSLESRTDDDGKRYTVSAKSTPEGLVVEGTEGRYLAPAEILPTTYWRPETVEQDVLLDTQRGGLLTVSATPKGTEVVKTAKTPLPAQRFALEGDLEVDLWYDPTGDWMKIAFSVRGSEINYVPVGPHRGLASQQQSHKQ